MRRQRRPLLALGGCTFRHPFLIARLADVPRHRRTFSLRFIEEGSQALLRQRIVDFASIKRILRVPHDRAVRPSKKDLPRFATWSPGASAVATVKSPGSVWRPMAGAPSSADA